MQQPAGVNEGGGQGWTLKAAARQDDMSEPACRREAYKRRGASRQVAAARLEAEAACREDERWRRRVERMGGGGGATTGVT
jgi:hypothetical protein